MEAIQEVLEKAPRSGFWKVHSRLRLKGYGFNHKRVYRMYCRLGLNLSGCVKRVCYQDPEFLSRLKRHLTANGRWI